MKIKRNRFNNRCMTPRNERKPHLALIAGLWRVSPKPREAYSSPSLQRLWTMAHYWANQRNIKLYGVRK